MNSITKRWARGSLLFTIIVLLLAESVFVYFTMNSNYENVRRALSSRATALVTQLSATEVQSGGTGRGVALRRMLEQFTDKDKFELMLLDYSGSIAASTAGYVAQNTDTLPDFQIASASASDMGDAVYRSSTGEKVMALTVLLPQTADDLIAIRLVTSLTLVDENILTVVLASLCLVTVIIFCTVWSGMFFVRSIVRPLAAIEHTAAKMAEGNLDIRLESKYNDEIGKLSNTINYMASELNKSNRLKNEFISSVSHELRTPLTSIKGWAETLGNLKSSEDANYRRGVQVISQEAERLYDMVEELLDFSRMQSGLTLQCEALDLVAEVSDTVLTVSPRLRQAEVTVQYEEPDMPVPVWADTARLRQVLLNILDNAAKYSPSGGLITVLVTSYGTNAFVSITDEGQGIAAEDLENVKVKFFKGKGAVRGSGIGLAVVDEIVTAHGGTVDLVSEPGHGTTVTVCLPLYDKNNPALTQMRIDAAGKE